MYILEEQSTECDNPGNSVPSPFDNCNTCRCSDDGVIEGCTKKLCFDGMLDSINIPIYIYICKTGG